MSKPREYVHVVLRMFVSRPGDRARTRATKSSAEDTKGDGGLRVVKRKLRAELATYLNHHHQPPPNLDVADQAPQFVASMAAIRGVRAVVRLAVDYSGTKHEDPEGAMAAFLQVARLASVKGPPGDENAAAAAHVRSRDGDSLARDDGGSFFDGGSVGSATNATSVSAEEEEHINEGDELMKKSKIMKEQLARSAAEAVAAIARRATSKGMANLGAADVPESLVVAMKALDETCHVDGSLARVVPWVMSTLRAAVAVARASNLALELRDSRIGRELGYLKPQLASIERTGPLNADATRCWRRIHYLCVQKPAELEAAMEAAEEAEDDDEGDSEEEEAADAATRRRRKELHTPRDRSNDDAALVAAASPHGVANHILGAIRGQDPIRLHEWDAEGDDRPGGARWSRGRRTTRSGRRPSRCPRPRSTSSSRRSSATGSHRSVAEEMWGHEAPKAPRKWHLDRPRPPAVSPAKARAELPHPLVPSRALRDRVFDKLMTGRVDEQPHHKRRFGEHK
ncbi:hypothetical protein JL720_11142 [Aureococcus anophagefferens]|nr:hypothetical protein JL720_11142 [Aureococcus anophagefferens]